MTASHPRSAFAVALLYAAIAAFWILLSDKLLASFLASAEALALASTIKGWLFVAVTSVLLHRILLRRSRPVAMPSHTHAGAHPRLSPALAATFVLVAAALTAAAVVLTHHWNRTQALEQLRMRADLHTRQVVEWLRERETDARLVQLDTSLGEDYRRWRDGRDPQARERLLTQLGRIASAGGFESVDIIDHSGALVSSDSDRSARLRGSLERYRHAAQGGGVGLVGPLPAPRGGLVLDHVVPLPGPAGPSGPLLVLRSEPVRAIRTLIGSPTVPGAAVEVLLLRREGEQILFVGRPGHASAAPAGDRSLSARLARGDAAVAQTLEGVDHRGTPVIGVGHTVPGTDWFLLARMEKAEIRARTLQDAVWIVLTGVLLAFLGLTALYLARQRRELAVARAVQETQAERLRSLDLLSAIADNADEAIYAKDLQGRYILFNRQAERITGIRKEQALGRDDTALFAPGQAEALIANDRSALQSGQVTTYQEELQTRAGPAVFLATKGPLTDDRGEVIGVFGVSRDITALRKSERELAAKEAHYRQALRVTNTGSWEMDVQTGKVFWSDKVEEIWGMEKGSFTGDVERVRASIHPEDVAAWEENVRACIEDGKEHDLELRVVHPDGSIRWVHAWGDADRDEWGNAVCLRGLVMDVTDRKRMIEALRESETRFRDLFEQSGDGVAVHDLQGRILDANQRLCDLFGYTKAELCLLSVPDICAAEGEGPERALAAVERLQRDGSATYESGLLTKAGATISGEISCKAITAGGKRLVQAVFRDVTERREAEASLRRSEQRFRTLFEHTPKIAVQGYDRERRIVFWNKASEELYGYRAEEAMGRRLEDLIIPEPMREPVIAAVDAWLAGGPDVPASELQLRHADGSVVDVFSSHYLIHNAEGEPELYCVDIDLGDLKKAEAQARKNEMLLSSVFQAIPDIFFLLDADGTIRDYRARSVRDLYLPPQRFLGKPLQEVLPPAMAAQFTESLEQARREGGVITYEYGLDLPSGRRQFEARLSPLPGHPQLIAVVRDITERKHTETELARQLEELRRWHDTTLGREGRVLELKGEVNALLSELKRPPRYPSAGDGGGAPIDG